MKCWAISQCTVYTVLIQMHPEQNLTIKNLFFVWFVQRAVFSKTSLGNFVSS